MNVTAIGSEQRLPAQEPPNHRQHCFKNRQTERDYRDGYGDDRRSLLGSGERKRAQHEADEQAPAVAQKDCRRVEVETKEPEDRTRQRERER